MEGNPVMNIKLIWNDYRRNLMTTIILVTFVAVASFLLTLTSVLATNLFGSIDRLMEESLTPHFMQMHTGEIDRAKIDDFAENNERVTDYQVIDFLGIENEKIKINGIPLTESTQDSGFVVQSNYFDFLLDLDSNIVEPKEGELYAPIYYYKNDSIKLGDMVEIEGVKFIVKGFIRDSQMSSALASSKRFLISLTDYNRLFKIGNVEKLIEFRLADINEIGSFETEYTDANLPANGPTLTWSLFRMVNAMSDGIMIAIILLISLIVVLISLLCVRFTLLSKIEEDYREIGVLKALGVRISDIRNMYIYNYGFLALLGIVFGTAISLVFIKPLNSEIVLNFGESGSSLLAFELSIISNILLFITIILFVVIILKRFNKISTIQALKFGFTGSNQKLQSLRESMFPINYQLGFKDVIINPKIYITLFVVFILTAFIISLPFNLYNSMSSKSFISYMGIGDSDLRIDIQKDDGLDETTEEIMSYIEDDSSVSKVSLLSTKTYKVLNDGAYENVKVELGDLSVFPIDTISGFMPKNENEIAISSLLSKDWNKKTGDTIILKTEKEEKTLIISGIYSDITNGGKTAKAVFNEDSKSSWNIIYMSFSKDVNLTKKYEEYNSAFKSTRVSSIDNYIKDIFGQTLNSINSARIISTAAACLIIFLIISLFLKLIIAKNKYSIAVTKAVGYTSNDLRSQYSARIFIVMIIGIIIGSLLSGTIGEKVVSSALATFGADGFKFETDLLITLVMIPLILITVTTLATISSTRKIGDIKIPELIKE